MNLILTLLYIEKIVWIFPAIRQYKNKYFAYFLTLGLLGIAGFICREVFSFNANIVNTFAFLFLLIAVLPKKFVRKYFYIFALLFLALVCVYLFFITLKLEVIIWVAFHILIFSIIFFDFLNELVIHEAIKWFYAVLLFYELSLIVEFFNMITETEGTLFYYLISMIAQILVGLFFCFVKPDSLKCAIKLKELGGKK